MNSGDLPNSEQSRNGDAEVEEEDCQRPPPGASSEDWRQHFAITERQSTLKGLTSHDYTLQLQRNNVTNAKCRARKCLVEELERGSKDNRIYGPWGLCLEAVVYDQSRRSAQDKQNRRFFHVSCFEALGVDLPKYLRLHLQVDLFQVIDVLGRDQTRITHTAIPLEVFDRVECGGKAFESAYYGPYEEEKEKWMQKVELETLYERVAVPEENLPKQPCSKDFIVSDPIERSLVDVLLDTLGAGPIMPLLVRENRLIFLERGTGPKIIKEEVAIVEVWKQSIADDSAGQDDEEDDGEASPAAGPEGTEEA